MADTADPNSSDPRSPEPEGSRTASRRLPRSMQIMLGIGGLFLGILVGGLSLAWFQRSEPLPTLTPEVLEAMQEKWKAQGPPDYDLTVKLSGLQTGTIDIEVRDGEVTSMTRDGHQPQQRRTWQYWSVPGQFDMIETDMANAEDPLPAFGVSDRDQVLLRADFDPRYGYPLHYQRIVLGNLGELAWQVTRFQPLRK